MIFIVSKHFNIAQNIDFSYFNLTRIINEFLSVFNVKFYRA